MKLFVLIAMAMAPAAFADPPPAALDADAEQAASEAVPEAAEPAAIDLAELDGLRAGDDVVTDTTTLQNLTATNSGNSVTADRIDTGAVNLSAGAFAGYNGIGNFVINTGNNNNLQGAVSVTVVMPPL